MRVNQDERSNTIEFNPKKVRSSNCPLSHVKFMFAKDLERIPTHFVVIRFRNPLISSWANNSANVSNTHANFDF